MKIAYSASCTVIVRGTMHPAELQRERDEALGISLCACGHQRNLHYADGGVTAPGFDWRGGTGRCQKRKCACATFTRIK